MSTAVYRRIQSKTKVYPESDCHIWTGKSRNSGVGVMIVEGAHIEVARWVYLTKVGPLDKNLTLRRACGNMRCINPTHLFPEHKEVASLKGSWVSTILTVQEVEAIQKDSRPTHVIASDYGITLRKVLKTKAGESLRVPYKRWVPR